MAASLTPSERKRVHPCVRGPPGSDAFRRLREHCFHGSPRAPPRLKADPTPRSVRPGAPPHSAVVTRTRGLCVCCRHCGRSRGPAGDQHVAGEHVGGEGPERGKGRQPGDVPHLTSSKRGAVGVCGAPFDPAGHKPRVGQVVSAASDRCLILNGMNTKTSMTSLMTMASETPLLAAPCSASLGRHCPQATAPRLLGAGGVTSSGKGVSSSRVAP